MVEFLRSFEDSYKNLQHQLIQAVKISRYSNFLHVQNSSASYSTFATFCIICRCRFLKESSKEPMGQNASVSAPCSFSLFPVRRTSEYVIKQLIGLPRLESAVNGVVAAYKAGASASTWLANRDRPPVDITQDVKDAYTVMSTQMALAVKEAQ